MWSLIIRRSSSGESLIDAISSCNKSQHSSIAECEFSALKKKTRKKRESLGVKTMYGQTVVLPGAGPFELGNGLGRNGFWTLVTWWRPVLGTDISGLPWTGHREVFSMTKSSDGATGCDTLHLP